MWARLFNTAAPNNNNKTTAGHAIPARQAELVHLLAKAQRLQGHEQEVTMAVRAVLLLLLLGRVSIATTSLTIRLRKPWSASSRTWTRW